MEKRASASGRHKGIPAGALFPSKPNDPITIHDGVDLESFCSLCFVVVESMYSQTLRRLFIGDYPGTFKKVEDS